MNHPVYIAIAIGIYVIGGLIALIIGLGVIFGIITWLIDCFSSDKKKGVNRC